MKRDCGPGELIPTSYKLLWYPTMADKEHQAKYLHLQDAKKLFEQKRTQLRHEGADIRLYACDKQGYCNCILSAKYHSNDVSLVIVTDRLDELP